MITWADAVEFCEWLSEEEGKQYSLPTEAQWEYACRAGSTTRWHFGDDVADLKKYAWYRGMGGATTKPVGLKEPNPFGLYDMYGNIREWCSDWYDAQYYRHSREEDPPGAVRIGFRVLRGGAFDGLPKHVRSAYRVGWAPESLGAGLRPVRVCP
jgi:formylglycine-generating enzyme required for sulfatase activity